MKYFKFFLLLLIASSCSYNREEASLASFLRLFDKNLDNYKQIVIVNVDVCNSCDDVVRDFLYLNAENEDLLIVFSSYSKKKIDLIIGQYDSINIVKDSKQRALEFDLVVNQPVLFTITKDNFQKKTLLLNELQTIFN